LEEAVDNAFDREHIRDLLEAESLAADSMDTSEIVRIREEMERYAARRLQPHYIRSFFMEAFGDLGGSMQEREPGRYRISYVPARIRNRPKELATTVLVKAVKDGAGRLDAPIAYSTGKSEEGYHTGLVFRNLGNVYFDSRALLVHPDHVDAGPDLCPKCGNLVAECTCEELKVCPECRNPIDACTCDVPPAKVKRYYGRVQLDSQRAIKDMGLIVEEVVERLTSQIGCDVEIGVEINARRSDGFDEGTIRTISENSRTLKFEDFGFEEG
jgi:hypothetical protein